MPELDATADTEYAKRKTRKSTNGGVLRHGQHVIKSWSTTQSVIALSTGEAEYYGAVKGSAIVLGAKSMAAELKSSSLVGGRASPAGSCSHTQTSTTR